MAHRLTGSRSVPVPLSGRDKNDVANGDGAFRLSFNLDNAIAFGDEQDLIERVRMVLIDGAVEKRDGVDPEHRAIRFADERLTLDGADKQIASCRHPFGLFQ